MNDDALLLCKVLPRQQKPTVDVMSLLYVTREIFKYI